MAGSSGRNRLKAPAHTKHAASQPQRDAGARSAARKPTPRRPEPEIASAARAASRPTPRKASAPLGAARSANAEQAAEARPVRAAQAAPAPAPTQPAADAQAAAKAPVPPQPENAVLRAGHRKKARPQARTRRPVLPLLLVAVGLLMCLAPVALNLYAQYQAATNVTTVTDAAEGMDEGERQWLLAQASAYNARLGGYEDAQAQEVIGEAEILPYDVQLVAGAEDATATSADTAAGSDAGGNAASAAGGNAASAAASDAASATGRAMGWIECPRAGITTTVYHGVSETVLSAGAGHQPETSLPVGGQRSHCFLTGHSGLYRQRVFDGIRVLEAGDVFAVHVLGEVYAYRVTGWEIVDPSGVDVTPDDGDVCTLVTCTTTPDAWNPKGRIGVNDKRLLVHGERCEYDPAEFASTAPDVGVYVNDNTRPLIIAAAVLLATAAGVLVRKKVTASRKAANRKTTEV